MRLTHKIATISMFATLLLFVTPGISFAQTTGTVSDSTDSTDATDRTDQRDLERDREQRQRDLERERDLQRDREQRDEERQKRIDELRDKAREKRLERERDLERERELHREQLEREVIRDFVDRPYNPDPNCPDWDLQLVNPEIDGISDAHTLKCYAKHLKAENDMLKNALVKIWGLMHRLANAYGVAG